MEEGTLGMTGRASLTASATFGHSERRQDAHDGTGLDTRSEPASCTGRLKGALANAQADAAVVHDIACRWYVARIPDAAVWKVLGALAVQKGLNGCA